jgi:CheY-like chemotaxis protein
MKELAGRLHVLVADDSALYLKTLSQVLKKAGYAVTAACDGKQAAELFEASSSAFQLVILDLSMPVWDGVAAAAHIRRCRARVPILFCSAQLSDYRERLPSGPGIATLAKPFALKDLLQRVDSLLPARQGTPR